MLIKWSPQGTNVQGRKLHLAINSIKRRKDLKQSPFWEVCNLDTFKWKQYAKGTGKTDIAMYCKKYLCSVKLNFIHKTWRATHLCQSIINIDEAIQSDHDLYTVNSLVNTRDPHNGDLPSRWEAVGMELGTCNTVTPWMFCCCRLSLNWTSNTLNRGTEPYLSLYLGLIGASITVSVKLSR